MSRCTFNAKREKRNIEEETNEEREEGLEIARDRMSISSAVGTDEERERKLECLPNTTSTPRAMETGEEKWI